VAVKSHAPEAVGPGTTCEEAVSSGDALLTAWVRVGRSGRAVHMHHRGTHLGEDQPIRHAKPVGRKPFDLEALLQDRSSAAGSARD